MNVEKRMMTRKSLPAKGIEFKESGSDIKAIYQILHFDIRKQRNNKKSNLISMNPTPPPLEIFTALV